MDEAEKRAEEAERQLAMQDAINKYTSDALEGKPVSDFAESFTTVRLAVELREERDKLRAVILEFLGDVFLP
jgi:hypothetical protein